MVIRVLIATIGKRGGGSVEKLIRIKDSALGYIDEQLNYYMDFLPEKINLVILGIMDRFWENIMPLERLHLV